MRNQRRAKVALYLGMVKAMYLMNYQLEHRLWYWDKIQAMMKSPKDAHLLDAPDKKWSGASSHSRG